MNARTVLMLGSGLAAALIANATMWLVIALDWAPGLELDLLDAQITHVLPAVVALVVSARRCSRDPKPWRRSALLTAAKITLLSYPLLAAIKTLWLVAEAMLGVGSVPALGWHALWLLPSAGVLFAATGFVLTILPMFAAEYAVVLLARRRSA
jgi:hypothetical protein